VATYFCFSREGGNPYTFQWFPAFAGKTIYNETYNLNTNSQLNFTFAVDDFSPKEGIAIFRINKKKLCQF
jgi:hypothetical protein